MSWLPRAWLPYLAPYGVFLLLVEAERWWPAGGFALFAARVALPAALLVGFARAGAYPELRGFRPGPGWLADVAVGLAIAALWVGPYLWLGLPRGGELWDPSAYGEGLRAPTLALRALGFALVTPFVEELFVRSFLLRQVDASAEQRPDFRELPIGRFAWPGLIVTTLWFTFTHVMWEWPVALPVGVAFTLWLYRRRHIGATILAHAVANGAIFAWVVLGPGGHWDFL